MRRAAAALSVLLLGAAPPEPQGKIAGIEVRFFDPNKGEFTANVLNEDGRFSGWNTFMTEGNSGYNRGDALVVVKLQLPNRNGRNFVIDGPLTIAARNGGKILARRRFTRIDLMEGNQVTRALYLEDIGCTGEIAVSAELAGQTKAARLIMSCGE